MDPLILGYSGEALGFDPGEGRLTKSLTRNRRLDYGRRMPRRRVCKRPDLAPERLLNLVDQGSCSCPACGRPIRLGPADDLCRAVDPHTRFTVHETFVSEDDRIRGAHFIASRARPARARAAGIRPRSVPRTAPSGSSPSGGWPCAPELRSSTPVPRFTRTSRVSRGLVFGSRCAPDGGPMDRGIAESVAIPSEKRFWPEALLWTHLSVRCWARGCATRRINPIRRGRGARGSSGQRS